MKYVFPFIFRAFVFFVFMPFFIVCYFLAELAYFVWHFKPLSNCRRELAELPKGVFLYTWYLLTWYKTPGGKAEKLKEERERAKR